MATTAAQLVVKIITDSKEAESGMKKMGDHIQKTGGLMSGLVGNMLSMAGGVGIANLAGDAFGVLKDQLVDSFNAGMQANQVMAQLSAGLKSTHDASGQTVQGLSDYAEKLSDSTGISKSAVETAQAMELTFTGIGKNVFPQVTQAAADMATKFNGGAVPNAQQMQQQALLLGKALNDPTKGLTALTREGVTFSDQQKQQITTMMKAGDTAGAQKVILKELSKEFGGSADAAGNANGGMAKLNAMWDNMHEQLGQALIPVVTQLMDKFTPLIVQIAQNLPGAIKTVTGILNSDLIPAVKMIAQKVSDFTSYLTTHADAMEAFKVALAAIAIVIAVALVASFVSWAIAAGAAAIATIAATWPILAVGAGIALLILGIVELVKHWGDIQKFFGNVKQAIGDFFSNLGSMVSGMVSNFVDAGKNMVTGLINGIKSMAGNLASALGSTVHNAVSSIPGLGAILPHLASGGTMAASGLALVGENGPEIVSLPGGAQVFPNSQISSVQPTATGGGGGAQTVYLQIDGRTFARVVMPHLTNAIYNQTGVRGVTTS